MWCWIYCFYLSDSALCHRRLTCLDFISRFPFHLVTVMRNTGRRSEAGGEQGIDICSTNSLFARSLQAVWVTEPKVRTPITQTSLHRALSVSGLSNHYQFLSLQSLGWEQHPVYYLMGTVFTSLVPLHPAYIFINCPFVELSLNFSVVIPKFLIYFFPWSLAGM